MTFRSILCPVDFSTHSRDALQHAVAMARRFGGRVTVLFVNDPLLLAAGSPSRGGRRSFLERTRIELERFVTRSVPPSSIDGDITLVVSTGNPADEILRIARRLRSDLIVIGTEGLSGLSKLFFGSTTAAVLGRVTIPALAIPPSRGRRNKGSRSVSIDRVLAPIDLAGEWQSDAIRAASLAETFDAPLVLIHVLAPVQAPPWLRSVSSGRRRIETARRALERVAAKLAPDRRVTCRVLEGSPAHEIARMTSPRSLVVMSLRGGPGVWGARRGSIAYHVLTHAATPVLALPRRRLGGRLSKRLATAVTAALSERDRIEMAGIDAILSAGSARRRART